MTSLSPSLTTTRPPSTYVESAIQDSGAHSLKTDESRRPLKKLAVVLQCASTGGWRFLSRLLEGIRELRSDLEITCFLGDQVAATFAVDRPHAFLENLRVSVQAMPPLDTSSSKYPWFPLLDRLRSKRRRRAYYNWIKSLGEFDLAFFAWPYFIEPPPAACPIVFLPHDFNYTHFMGAFTVMRDGYEHMRAQHGRWLNSGYPVTSSHFIARELRRTFPDAKRQARVIHLSQLGRHKPLDDEQAESITKSLGIEGDFVLNINNISHHKNLGQVIGGMHYVLEQFPKLKLVVAGYGTEGIKGRANSPWYVDNCEDNANVISVGMRSDEEITALIQKARVVVNASVYEAGNGSGLDAWALGTPVAMSAIPSFLEQMEILGVKATTFNPRCCYQIRDAILAILTDPASAARDAAISRDAIEAYSWNKVASKYIDFFEEVISIHASGS